jgi:aminopeptidase N
MKYVLFLCIFFQSVIQSQDSKFNGNIIEYDLKKYQGITNFEKIQYLGDQKIDINYYNLDLTITYSPNYIIGNVTVQFLVDTASINSLFLDLMQNMIVDSIIINESTHAIFTHQENKINISLDREYSIDEVITITVYYQGLPVNVINSCGFNFDTHNGYPVLWSASEPYFANYWWPCKDTPADKADSADIILTVDTSLIPASNGIIKNILNNGNGTHTYTWKVSYPIAQYLISVAISNYQLYTNYYVYSTSDSLAITNYLYPESYTPQNLNKLDIIPEMLAVYSSLLGEYPFINEKFGHAECYTAMENQTITSIVAFDEDLMQHETAHQWFGDKVTCRDWHHIWLNEGFATFLSALWREKKFGSSAYDQYILSLANFAKTLDSSVWVEDISNVSNIFRPESYIKGGVVLHMLRGVMDDSLFLKTIYAYANDAELSYNVAVTEDFQRVAESVYGNDLDYFFSQWIYGKKYPKYNIYWNKEQVDSTWNLWLKIEQIINISPPYFTMPVELKINYAAEDTIIKLFNNSQIQEYLINIPNEPTSLVFDVDRENISSIFDLSQNYPNPFNPSTKIKFTIPQSPLLGGDGRGGLVTLKVYDVLGNEVATLVNENKPAGSYEIEFGGTGLPSGVYFYRLQAGGFVETKKMILLR